MNRFRSFGTVVPALLALGSCASPTDIPTRAADADGFVMSVSSRSVHIKAANEQCGIVFGIDDDTRILTKHADGTIVRAGIGDVSLGRGAQGWADGGIAESCPAQARAQVVVLN